MDTVAMNSGGCYVEHDFLIADEYGEEVKCMGWIPPLTLHGAVPAALFMHQPDDPARSSFPYADLPRAPVKATAFPKCP